MAKVLRSKKEGIFYTQDSARHCFEGPSTGSPDRAKMELFIKEEHADELIATYPNVFTVVPEKEWPPRFKDAVRIHNSERVAKVAEDAKDLIKAGLLKIVPPDKEK